MNTQNQQIQRIQYSEKSLLEEIAELTPAEFIRRNTEEKCQPENESGNLAEYVSNSLVQAGFPRLNPNLFERGRQESDFKVLTSPEPSPEMDRRIHNGTCFNFVQHRLWDCRFKSGAVVRVLWDKYKREGFFLRIPTLAEEPVPAGNDVQTYDCLGREIYTFSEGWETHEGYSLFFPDSPNDANGRLKGRGYISNVGQGKAEGTFTCRTMARIPMVPVDIEKKGYHVQRLCSSLISEAMQKPDYQHQHSPNFKLYELWVPDPCEVKVEVIDFTTFEIEYEAYKIENLPQFIRPGMPFRGLKRGEKVVCKGLAYGNELLNESREQTVARWQRLPRVELLPREEYQSDGCPALILRIEKQPGVNKEYNHLIALWKDPRSDDQKLESMIRTA